MTRQHDRYFNEDEWLRLIFMLHDTQKWINTQFKNALQLVPVSNKKKLLRQTYYLSVQALAHILERHYHKVPRHQYTSKFTIPAMEILSLLRDAAVADAIPILPDGNFKRTICCGHIIGYDNNHIATPYVTVITDPGGRVITAFPGIHQESSP